VRKRSRPKLSSRFQSNSKYLRKVVYTEGFFYGEAPVFCSAQAVKKGPAAEGFAEVARKGADISAFGAIRGNLKNSICK